MSDPGQQEAELKALIDAAPGLFQVNIAFVASAAWFLWDWVISIDQEVEHFWGKKPTTGTVLYFVNRLVGLFIILIHFQTSVRPLSVKGTNRLCEPFVVLILVFNGVSGLVVQTVLALRTYALWDCNKYVLWFLMVSSVTAVLAQEAFVGVELTGVVIVYNPLPAPYTGCLPIFKRWTWQRYVPIVAFEIMAASFMLIKFLQLARQRNFNRVFYVIFRDGFLEFIAVTVTTIYSLFVGIFQSGSSSTDLVTFDITSSISLICCARMLLNIRDVLTLSDPRDTTKPNPWSLDASFDVRYGLGGMNEITREHIRQTASTPVSEDLVIPIGRSSNAGMAGDGGMSPNENNESARERAKLKARDEEESGADADKMFDPGPSRGRMASASPNIRPKSPSRVSRSSSTWDPAGDTRMNLGSSADPSNAGLRPQLLPQFQDTWMDEDLEKGGTSGLASGVPDASGGSGSGGGRGAEGCSD